MLVKKIDIPTQQLYAYHSLVVNVSSTLPTIAMLDHASQVTRELQKAYPGRTSCISLMTGSTDGKIDDATKNHIADVHREFNNKILITAVVLRSSSLQLVFVRSLLTVISLMGKNTGMPNKMFNNVREAMGSVAQVPDQERALIDGARALADEIEALWQHATAKAAQHA